MDKSSLIEMRRNEFKQMLIDECECTPEEVNDAEPAELLDLWLYYQGIIGWTDDIIEAVNSVYGTDLTY